MGVVFEFITQTFASGEFLLLATLIALAAKIYFVSVILPVGIRKSYVQTPWFLLLGVIIGAMFNDITWIIKLIHKTVFTPTDYTFVITIIRIDWALRILQYQFFSLFLVSLVERNFKLTFFNTVQLVLSGLCSSYFLYFAFFDETIIDLPTQIYVQTQGALSPIELIVMKYVMLYLCAILVLPSILYALKKLRSSALPVLLAKQLRTFIVFLLIPFLATEFFQMTYFSFCSFRSYFYLIFSIATILLLLITYYCIKRVLEYRFLNMTPVTSDNSGTATFIDDFKNTLEGLSHATSIQELGHLTQTFFKESFGIPLRKTAFYVRPRAEEKKKNSSLEKPHNSTEKAVESYINTHDIEVSNFIEKQKILSYDEIAFSNFYEESSVQKNILSFLESINAALFIPIYTKHQLSAYIVVEQQGRAHPYNKLEFDLMLIFARYVGTSISLIQNKIFDSLLLQEKKLKDELYYKHQEANHYKESLQSFLRTAKQNQVGVIFYKNRHFIFGNQAAKELIRVDINQEEGHPITRTLKKLALHIEAYKSQHTVITTDVAGNKLLFAGAPSLDRQTILITVHYLDLTDIITHKNALLKDQNSWDYLLYLETTQAGKLIETLIPGQGETILNFKIDLLKASFSKKALLVEAPEEDVLSIVEVIHHIGMRETLQILTLHGLEHRFETAIKLFGTNPLFNVKQETEPLLKKLQTSGTLLIKNVQFLSLETQEHLAEYIHSGLYRLFKSDQKIPSSARIICSSSNNIMLNVKEETFSPSLYSTFKEPILSMPSLLTLAEQEFYELVDGFVHQAVKTETFKNLLELSDKEKNKLALNRPATLHELKTRVQLMLINKSKKHHIHQEAYFDPAYEVSDPELVEAARLGKHALRDQKIMGVLWHKFKSQNKIATFLGVNRSSVNRRCKEYNLI